METEKNKLELPIAISVALHVLYAISMLLHKLQPEIPIYLTILAAASIAAITVFLLETKMPLALFLVIGALDGVGMYLLYRYILIDLAVFFGVYQFVIIGILGYVKYATRIEDDHQTQFAVIKGKLATAEKENKTLSELDKTLSEHNKTHEIELNKLHDAALLLKKELAEKEKAIEFLGTQLKPSYDELVKTQAELYDAKQDLLSLKEKYERVKKSELELTLMVQNFTHSEKNNTPSEIESRVELLESGIIAFFKNAMCSSKPETRKRAEKLVAEHLGYIPQFDSKKKKAQAETLELNN